MKTDCAANEITRALDKASSALESPANLKSIVVAAKKIAAAAKMRGALDWHNQDWELRKRTNKMQDLLTEAVSPYVSMDLESKILHILGESKTYEDRASIKYGVANLTQAIEEARVHMMFALGREFLISWPDTYSGEQISSALRRLEKAGKVRSVWRLTPWISRKWMLSIAS